MPIMQILERVTAVTSTHCLLSRAIAIQQLLISSFRQQPLEITAPFLPEYGSALSIPVVVTFPEKLRRMRKRVEVLKSHVGFHFQIYIYIYISFLDHYGS